MQFDQGLSQRQAKAGSFILAGEVAVDLLKGSQRLRNVLKCDPNASIDDLEYEAALRARPCPERDLAAGRGEFDRVG